MKKPVYTTQKKISDFQDKDISVFAVEYLTMDEDGIGLFEPLEFLNLLYNQFAILKANKESPILFMTHLKEQGLNEKQLYILLGYLSLLLLKEIELDPKITEYKICSNHITKELKRLDKLLYNEVYFISDAKFDFEELMKELETIPDQLNKLILLNNRLTEYLQRGLFEDRKPSFGEKCELEIKKLKVLIEIQSSIAPQTKQAFQLIKKQGAKTDLIRVLNAVYELKLFEMTNGQTPSKEMFMKQTGEFFGVDLSKYDIDLSQALNNTSLEANLKVFDEMKKLTQNSHYISKK